MLRVALWSYRRVLVVLESCFDDGSYTVKKLGHVCVYC